MCFTENDNILKLDLLQLSIELKKIYHAGEQFINREILYPKDCISVWFADKAYF